MRREWIHAGLLLAPALVLLFAFTHLPAVQTVIDSFFSTARGRRPSVFVGLANYERLLADATFMRAMVNNAIYAAITIPVSIGLALAMALFVHRHIAGRAFLRMAYFTPTVLPLIAVANIWLFFFLPGFGLFEQLRGLIGLSPRNWVGSPDSALYAVMMVTIWNQAGFFMIFYLAALQTIPDSLREAAAIEGTPRWVFFRRVIWPLLMPTTLFLSVNATINAFRMIDHVFVMTQGGPNNASMLLLYYIYEQGFRFWDSAYAATLTVVMVVILAIVGIGQFFLMDRRVHYK
ncbi:MAG: sn-glycerol 3-phosphate transport system permease protein [Saliniramus fredricksonii]|jgi:sn-glycerol 3-phosphate transport system permease protein|uniref:Carbohydrate ABC transporter membrane protein 1, CUT1 family n=1 Tax=Saliniramus fredricksonii TaxID=1653334 RepID=A0A0N8KEM5_9HYPH|nr:sugar ABC transporter permease [Saliniramus fredricksonii]KPQ11754.1 MAG: sn-glycerol 3-phosphate transport system permease protein [Saliniramus fredricksonii]SCC82320.1 carbohydrate ABC transporter membrane protein 1, CUT1 family [Saliniramus fredricksonii]